MKRVLLPVTIISIMTLSMSPLAIARSPQRPSSQQPKPYVIAQGAEGGSAQGGGRRSGCPPLPGELLLTALVPQVEGAVIGRTIAERPTFWFYVPYNNQSKFPARFSLQDNQEQTVYETLVPLPPTNGIIAVQLPASAKPLSMNTSYQWTLQLECTRPAITVWGWVRRVAPPAGLNAAASLPAPQRAAALMQNGLWLDALTALGNARRANPNDSNLNQAWTQLFSQVTFDLHPSNKGRLTEIIQQPLIK